jgi:hypothetical protein
MDQKQRVAPSIALAVWWFVIEGLWDLSGMDSLCAKLCCIVRNEEKQVEDDYVEMTDSSSEDSRDHLFDNNQNLPPGWKIVRDKDEKYYFNTKTSEKVKHKTDEIIRWQSKSILTVDPFAHFKQEDQLSGYQPQNYRPQDQQQNDRQQLPQQLPQQPLQRQDNHQQRTHQQHTHEQHQHRQHLVPETAQPVYQSSNQSPSRFRGFFSGTKGVPAPTTPASNVRISREDPAEKNYGRENAPTMR